jgi:hypothetical protein
MFQFKDLGFGNFNKRMSFGSNPQMVSLKITM